MTEQRTARRPGGRSALVRAKVHQAVEELLTERGPAELSVPRVAERAGVNPTSVYRRWRTIEGLISDAAIARLDRRLPLPDTGSLHGDLTAWASASAADLGRPEGRLFLLALVVSLPVTPEGQAERSRYLQHRLDGVSEIAGRAADRGENPPDAEVIVDAIMGPLYLRALWGFLPADPGYPRSLVDRLLGVTARDGELDRHGASRPAPPDGHEITPPTVQAGSA